MKCDGTRAETRFRLSAKRKSPFKSVGASDQSTTGGRGVRISGCNAGYTMFRGSVKSTGYPLHSPVSPFTSPPVRHRVPSHFNWTLSLLPLCFHGTLYNVFSRYFLFLQNIYVSSTLQAVYLFIHSFVWSRKANTKLQLQQTETRLTKRRVAKSTPPPHQHPTPSPSLS